MVILSGGVAGCEGTALEDREGQKRMAKRTIEEVLEEYTEHWMSVAGVVGTAQGHDAGRPCIKVYVVARAPELDRKIPKVIEGYPVVMEATGKIRALPENQD